MMKMALLCFLQVILTSCYSYPRIYVAFPRLGWQVDKFQQQVLI